jgi:dihydropyrimidinase
MAFAFDMVIRSGRVVTGGDQFVADVGIKDGVISAIGSGLSAGARDIDASGQLVLPGGVDNHAHIEQISASGLLNADDWESATKAAAFGGNTSVIAFAAQHVGMDLRKVVDDYHALARKGAVIDYSFHLIIADPNPQTLGHDLPPLLERGYQSVKLFTTYDKLKIDDESFLDILQITGERGGLVSVHAENHGMIKWRTKNLVASGHTAPIAHAMAHPREAEIDAIARVIRMAELTGQPIMIFHVSTAEGAEIVRQARRRGQTVYAETCPHYLLLTEAAMDRPLPEGAMWMCSPPLRQDADREALWAALDGGVLQMVSSDHAPYAYDATGKLRAGPMPRFDQIPSGLPGIGLRLPLMFDDMVRRGLPLEKFVEWTSTAPAKLYGLYPRKGSIAVGADADMAIWNPKAQHRVTREIILDRTGYSPYQDRVLTGWPETVLLRGQVIVEQGVVTGQQGFGQFLAQDRARSGLKGHRAAA